VGISPIFGDMWASEKVELDVAGELIFHSAAKQALRWYRSIDLSLLSEENSLKASESKVSRSSKSKLMWGLAWIVGSPKEKLLELCNWVLVLVRKGNVNLYAAE